MDSFEHPWFDTVGGTVLPPVSEKKMQCLINLYPMNRRIKITGLSNFQEILILSESHMVCRPLFHRTLVKLGGKFLSKKLRAKRSFLYIKDIYGTRAFWNPDELIKTSLFMKEILLRIAMYSIKAEYNHLKSIGMLQWPSYKEEEAAINRLLQIIYRQLDVHKHRRLRTRLFYLCPPPNKSGHILLRSPLYRMPLKEALKRRRLDIKRERKILTRYNKKGNASSTSVHVSVLLKTTLRKVCAKSLLLCTIGSVFIGFVIILIP